MVSGFVYDGHVGDIGALDGEAAVVVVVDPTYIPSESHEFVTDLTGELGREDVTLDVTTTVGVVTLAFVGADPEVDITSTSVGGWALALDGASDAVRSLVVYQDHPGGVADDPLPIVCPDGIAKAQRA